MPDRAYHHGNLRAALLERAWDAIEKDGADRLSLRRLARDLGVSHGASARHFHDREALLDAIAVEGFRRLNDTLAAATVRRPGEGYEATFRASADAYIEFALAHPAILDVMYAAKRLALATTELREASSAGMIGVVAMIDEAQQDGEIASGDPELLAVVVFASVHGVATLAIDDLLNGVEISPAVTATVDLVWRGLVAGNVG